MSLVRGRSAEARLPSVIARRRRAAPWRSRRLTRLLRPACGRARS